MRDNSVISASVMPSAKYLALLVPGQILERQHGERFDARSRPAAEGAVSPSANVERERTTEGEGNDDRGRDSGAFPRDGRAGRRVGSRILQPFEVNRHFPCRLIPVVRILLQTLEDDALELRREVRVERPRCHGWAIENGIDELWALVLRKRPLPGRHLIDHRAQCVDVAASIAGLVAKLLGRHVRQRAGDLLRGRHRRRLRGPHGGSEDPRQAEVENLGDSLVSHHDVPRLQVPVNDSVLVRLFERVRNLRGEREHLSLGQLRLRQPVGQRRSGDELHDQEIQAVLRVEIVDGAYVCVIQLGQGQSLFAQLRAGLIGPEGSCRQDLQRDVTFEPFVSGAVDDTHAAGTDLLDQLVVAQDSANHRVSGILTKVRVVIHDRRATMRALCRAGTPPPPRLRRTAVARRAKAGRTRREFCMKRAIVAFVLAAALSLVGLAQGSVTVFEGARVIVGDGRRRSRTPPSSSTPARSRRSAAPLT